MNRRNFVALVGGAVCTWPVTARGQSSPPLSPVRPDWLDRHKEAIDEASGVKGWVIHDCRRTSRTLLSRAGVNADIAERCLGHVIGGVRGTYDRHEYYEEKAHAFEALAAQIDRIINPPAANVVAMRRGRDAGRS